MKYLEYIYTKILGFFPLKFKFSGVSSYILFAKSGHSLQEEFWGTSSPPSLPRLCMLLRSPLVGTLLLDCQELVEDLPILFQAVRSSSSEYTAFFKLLPKVRIVLLPVSLPCSPS